MTNNFIDINRSDGVTVITLSDPQTRNALSPEMALELYDAFEIFESSSDEKVLILTGLDPSFCSGANIKKFDQAIDNLSTDSTNSLPWGGMEARLGHHQIDRKHAGFGSVSNVPLRINEIQKPTIAAVNGHAVGVGLGIALSCDIRIASENAQFAEAFVRMGLVPGDGSCWQLPHLIGLSNTYYMQYTGDRLDAHEAYRMNLVSKVHPHDELMASVVEFAKRLAEGATYSMSLTKYLVQQSFQMSLADSLSLAQTAQELARRSDDHKEAVKAFLEKRKPIFRGK
ncbi:MAG: enoyl-CoA hydratase-related protein [Dehalococcoidia bacterium]|jgi:enoyl-CoA hydratase/carnithine racemase|nr:enoyl-CoA hydratase-related protein [Dehalococcoidia bacterium]